MINNLPALTFDNAIPRPASVGRDLKVDGTGDEGNGKCIGPPITQAVIMGLVPRSQVETDSSFCVWDDHHHVDVVLRLA